MTIFNRIKIVGMAVVLAALLSAAVQAEDSRLQPVKDLNGYFPFTPPSSLSAWEARKEYVRRQILVATGLWPKPTKMPLKAVIHGKMDLGDYTIEKVYFESVPGFFVTGNLYRPKNIKGRVPGVLFAHGHAKDARLSQSSPDAVRRQIADGAERFENGGRAPYQARLVQLARMGCVVWHWDMLGDSDSIQLSRQLVHGFAKQRPEMNTTTNWGLFSPQAEAHCQCVMGLQTLNSMRGLDFLLSLPEVDPERIAMTGESGGGTQTMILAAIDDRIKLSFPVVMVSTSMQGGCTCENASLLRVNTGNVEFAALFAPKPQGMNTANDWTKEMSTKGFPELQKLYALYGKKDNVYLLRGEHFPHNYNAVTRSAFYTFLNRYFKLGLPSPVIEKDFDPLPPEKLTVWGEQYPAPKAADPEFERKLLKHLTVDADKQVRAAAATGEGLQKIIRPALEILVGRTYANAGTVEWKQQAEQGRGDHQEKTGTLQNKTYDEEVPVVWLLPKQWNGRVVVWLNDKGKVGLQDEHVSKLVKGGTAVIGADLFCQGSTPSPLPLSPGGRGASGGEPRNRVVANPREFAGYTFGYSPSLFAQRTHDVFTIVTHLRKNSARLPLKSVAVAGWGCTGPIALAARALAGEAIDRAAVDTNGFRFGKLLDYRDPMFLPGGAKYLDVPGLIALNAPHSLWLTGEGEKPEVFGARFNEFFTFAGEAGQKETSAALWLVK